LADSTSSGICAIINPRAGGWKRLPPALRGEDQAVLVARWLAPQAPDSIRIMVMGGPQEGTALARAALAEGYETIVAVGGDGTLNDVIQALGHADRSVRLGLIPMGTANVLARVLGLPIRDPAAAADIVRAGHERCIDLGRCGEQWFALVVGVGFDGAVTLAVNPDWKRRYGRLAYLLAAMQVVWRYPTSQITVTADGCAPVAYDAYLALIANGGRYAGNYHLADNVQLDDGLFDLFICRRRGPLIGCLFRHGFALLGSRLDRAPGVTHLRARHVSVTSDRQLPVQADGDPIGTTPTVIEVAPARLRILAPPASVEEAAKHVTG
jgi:diacylglycerol kinase (ATP)